MMDYNFNVSLANLHNVVVALNQGGMLTCEDIMNRLWDDAPISAQSAKINAPRNPAVRTHDYARQQLKQEVRRSLYGHFNDVASTGYFIHRASPLGSPEYFWVTDVQESPTPVEHTRGNTPELAVYDSPGVVTLHDDEPAVTSASPLIERLVAANNSTTPTSELLTEALDNSVVSGNNFSFISESAPQPMLDVMTNEINDLKFPATPQGRSDVSRAVANVITQLQDRGL